MPLTVTVAATATDLCTLEDFPDVVRGTDQVNDPRLSVLITRASAAIYRYCHCLYAQQTYSEDVAGYGSTVLQLGRSPIPSGTFAGLFPGGPLTVTSVNELSTEISPTLTPITDFLIHNATAHQLYRAGGWNWTAQLVSDLSEHPKQGSERPLFRVVYTCGFTCPRQGTPSTTVEGTLPYDLREAAIQAVSEWWYAESRSDVSGPVTSRRMGDVAITYATRSEKGVLSERVQDLLVHWVRW